MKEKKNLRQALWRKPELFIKNLFREQDWALFRSDEELDPETSTRLFRQILENLDNQSSAKANHKSFQIYWPGLNAMAATMLLVVVSIALWKASWQERPSSNGKLALELVQDVPQWKQYRNDTKQRQRFYLADSSFVILYPGSSLKHRMDFARYSRTIFLSGRAFFDVVKDRDKPFTVFAGGVKTTALGTSFTINTLGKGETTLVRLHSGKVRVEIKNIAGTLHKKVLIPGEQFAFNRMTHRESLPIEKPKKVAPPSSYARMGTSLQFRNISIDQVFHLLEENYGTAIEVETSALLQHNTYTGDIDMQVESLQSVLQKICLLNGLILEQREKETFRVLEKNSKSNTKTNNNNH